MRPVRLRTKFTAFYAAVSLLLLAAFSVLFYRLLAYQMDKDLTDDLNERATALRGYLRFESGLPVLNYDSSDPDETYFINRAARYYQVWDLRDGRLLVQSPELKSTGIVFTADEIRDLSELSSTTQMRTEQIHIRFHNSVIHLQGSAAYLLQVGVSLESLEAALTRLLDVILWLVPVGALMAGASGWYLAGRVLRPVDDLGAAAGEIGITRLDKRLPVRGTHDELDRLAETFNQVFERLERAVSEMKEFTAAVSHELRTPLTVLRGETEVALSQKRSSEEYRQVLESQLEEFDKLAQMINQMLTLARAESGEIQITRQALGFSALTGALVDQMRPLAAWKDISLNLRAESAIEVAGDASWLERAIFNLLDNAIKFTGQSGRVDVTVGRRGAAAILEVRDTGIGIPQEALPHIFRRFYRVDSSRSQEHAGAGLGLSLVEWIVRQHGGSVAVESRPGAGSTFTVELPLAARAPDGL
jgi:two-component system OmpR family sensor kinase